VHPQAAAFLDLGPNKWPISQRGEERKKSGDSSYQLDMFANHQPKSYEPESAELGCLSPPEELSSWLSSSIGLLLESDKEAPASSEDELMFGLFLVFLSLEAFISWWERFQPFRLPLGIPCCDSELPSSGYLSAWFLIFSVSIASAVKESLSTLRRLFGFVFGAW